jgi:hypothetical protein
MGRMNPVSYITLITFKNRFTNLLNMLINAA